jgi:LuxR family maltose regulon positive regulatory protein
MSKVTQKFNPILRTKLYGQQLTAELVNRDRLIKAMNRAHEVPLTLVSAPAGYGKSILAAQWVEQLNNPIAWLSLDTRDTELRTFLAYFLAAVDTATPGACEATLELLDAVSLPPIEVLASYLLNDLDAIGTPGAIILDDYHSIGPLSPVHVLMGRILEYPPRQFRFVVLTRQDPPFDLASLRAGNRINEVRLQDLRFKPPEMSEFLTVVADLPVSDESLTKLEGELEGWAAGLRLLSLALQHVADPDGFLKTMQGSLPQIQDYLLQEVLGGLGGSVLDCMLASSILDRFCAEVLDAICEATDRAAAAGFAAADFLEHLRKNNLFTISIDAQGRWFRYHHLFRELLKEELQRLHGPDHVSALDLRASQWFEDDGLIDEAIKHALAAEDMDRVVQLITRHRHAALNTGRWYDLQKWLSLIPDGIVLQRAELLLARAWILLNHRLQIEPVPALLDRVESLLGDDLGLEPIRGELALCRGYFLWLTGDGASSLEQMKVAIDRIPVSHVEVRSHAEIVFAVSTLMTGTKEQAIRFVEDRLPSDDSTQDVRRSRLLFALVFVHLVAGDLPSAELAIRRLRRVVKRIGSVFALAWTDYIQGIIHLIGCEWEAAIEYLERAVTRRFGHNRRAATDSCVGIMLAYQALGQEDQARGAIQVLHDYVAYQDDPASKFMTISAETRLALLQRQPRAAELWLDSGDPPPEGFLFWWIDVPLVTRCRAMIGSGSPGSLTEAVARLQEYAALNEAHHNTLQLIEALALLTMAYEKQGKTEEALEALERSVTMAGKGNVLLPFVELGTPMVDLLHKLAGEREFIARVERLVTAFGTPMDRSIAPEPGAGKFPTGRADGQRAAAGRNLQNLTNRELDVLELLALRLQNKEIAARLNISYQTVGSHLKQIYQKLGVQGRREAVERAVERRILNRYPPN